MNIKEICATLIRGEQVIKFPLTIHCGRVHDANSHHVLDIRGWGNIQYHSDGPDAAAALQDAIGDWVVKTLNEEAKRHLF